jgi:tRNA-modifying protein YgfZ
MSENIAVSPLLAIAGAVEADPPDAGVAAHYGDPLREQRTASRGAAVVDRTRRGVLRVGGPDRLGWLHSITSQHLEALPPWRGTELLVLSPHGHVEHHALVADDGDATWLDVEPGTAAGLLAFLASMRFLLRVDPADVTDAYAVLSVLGPAARDVVDAAFPGDGPPAASGAAGVPEPDAAGSVAGFYPVRRGAGGTLVRWMPYGADLLIERPSLEAAFAALNAAGAEPAGIAAFEALRVEARRPRLGSETDHRTIPHEVGWLATAVHLDKGCYRGQETVARVHNLGRPPRRMVLLHTDGATPPHGAPVLDAATGRQVGVVGTAAVHHELGPIALAVVKRSTPDDAALIVGLPGETIDAAIEPSGEAAAPTRHAGRVPG